MTHPLTQRRQLLKWSGSAIGLGWSLGYSALAPANGLQARPLHFPRDHGTHNDAHTEWWYLTGYGQSIEGNSLGYQVTFFRRRVSSTQNLKSRLAAKQLLFAHAAITDIQGKRLWHDQRIARWNGEQPAKGLEHTATAHAFASAADTHIALGDWSLRRTPDGTYRAVVKSQHIGIDLVAAPTQEILLQGQQGFSRKGPDTSQSSFYVTHPQLDVKGRLELRGRTVELQSARAWLDHEWSQDLMHPEAVGWDWIGMNLSNGDTLTAFQMRRADGSVLWAGGSWRSASQRDKPWTGQSFTPDQVRFVPLRHWESALTKARYPVAWRVSTPFGAFTVQALLDNQELDSSRSTGTVYWEGLSELLDAQDQPVGRGYLEMTGYVKPLVL